MEWNQRYTQTQQPDFEEIGTFIENPLWSELNSHLQQRYKVTPKIEYSKCAAARGWNVKYQKGGRSLCTLYPMQGFFIALVVIGNREMTEAELFMPCCCEYTQNLFQKVQFSCGGKWLMMQIDSQEVLEDVKNLIAIRAAAEGQKRNSSQTTR